MLGLCDVACGRVSLYFHTALKAWDNAAAFLIVREAGGQVCRFDGTTADLLAPAAIAGNRDLVTRAVRLFQDA